MNSKEALVRKDDSFTEFEERKIGNGYLNSDESDSDKVVIVLWDIVSIGDDFKRD